MHNHKHSFRGLIFIFAAFILLSSTANAQRYQDKKRKPIAENTTSDTAKKKFSLPEKLTFGGNMGLQFGSTTYIDLSPLVGYKIKPYWVVGAGPSYSYLGFRQKDPNGAVIFKYSTSNYGGRAYMQYLLPFFENVFVLGEYQAMNVQDFRFYPDTKRTWVTSPLIGGGFQSQLGRRSYYSLTVLFNLNYARNHEISPFYNSPLIIRAGIML